MSCEKCENEARYTAPVPSDPGTGERLCALHSIDRVAVRDTDVPRLVAYVDELLNELHAQCVSAGFSVGQNIRGMIGRNR